MSVSVTMLAKCLTALRLLGFTTVTGFLQPVSFCFTHTIGAGYQDAHSLPTHIHTHTHKLEST